MKNFIERFKLVLTQLNTKTEQTVARILFNNSMTISVAESCTGGLISSRLTDIAGSSSYAKENYVTYSNESKINILNVSPETLETHGAVSEECAIEMVEGLFTKTGCDICIATTGIAGPTAPESDKPIGLLYVAIKNQYSTSVKQFNIESKHGRKTLKYIFSQKALEFLCTFLQENYAATMLASKSL
jgi:PncC family amidohydrolase